MSNNEEASAKWAACELEKVLVRLEELVHDARVRLSEPSLTKNNCTKHLSQELLE